jgi:hypothetical protein
MSITKSTAYADLGTPTGLTVRCVIGVAHVADFVYVFAQASDYHIWCKFFCNNTWSTWVDLGQPTQGLAAMDGPRNCVLSAGNSIWVYALDKKGKICCNLWNGAGWSNWLDAPSSPTDPQNTTTISQLLGATNNGPMVVYGKDANNAYQAATWSGVMWVWTKTTAAPLLNNTAGMVWDHTTYTPNPAGVGGGATLLAASAAGGPGLILAGGLIFGVVLALQKTQTYSTIAINFTVNDGGHVLCNVAGSEEKTDVTHA